MKNVIAIIAAAIAAFGQRTWQMVKRSGRWVLEMVTPSSPAMIPTAMPPALTADTDNPVSDHNDEVVLSLRRVMRAYIVGERPDPETLQSLPQTTRDWVRCLDQRQVQICMSAGDDQLAAHLKGIQPFRGVPRHDPETVAELMRVREMDKSAKLYALEARVARRRRETIDLEEATRPSP